jgi:predicted PurR-regulated permease PerM
MLSRGIKQASYLLDMIYPTRFQQKTLWSAITGLAILILGILFGGLVWLLGQIFGFLQPVLVPLIVAGIIAYLLEPIARTFEKRGISRLWAVILIYLGILCAITLLTVAVLPAIEGGKKFMQKVFSEPAKTENTGAVATDLSEVETTETPPVVDDAEPVEKEDLVYQPESEPDLVPPLARSIYKLKTDHKDGVIGWLLTEVTDGGEPIAYARGAETPESLDFFWRTRGGRTLYDYKDELFSLAKSWLYAGSSKLLGFLGFILGMIMVPVYLFFFLKHSASIREHWHEYVPLRASRFKTELVSTLQEINGYLISFFRGQVVVGVIDGFLVGIALFFFDLPYALLIGVFMAILGIIPYIGNIICLIPACIIAYLHAQSSPVPFDLEPWPYVGFVVLIFAGVQQINSLVTAPKIVGDSVGLHPLTVIFSMLFWSLVLGGFVGALLAVPLTAAVKVVFSRYFWEKTMNDPATDTLPT